MEIYQADDVIFFTYCHFCNIYAICMKFVIQPAKALFLNKDNSVLMITFPFLFTLLVIAILKDTDL